MLVRAVTVVDGDLLELMFTVEKHNHYAVWQQSALGRGAGQVDGVMSGRIFYARLRETAFCGIENASDRDSSLSSTSAAARWVGGHCFPAIVLSGHYDKI